jgi:hypothetical protein
MTKVAAEKGHDSRWSCVVSSNEGIPSTIFISNCWTAMGRSDFDDEHVDVYRCFHFNADKVLALSSLIVKIMALSGSARIDFQSFGWEKKVLSSSLRQQTSGGTQSST